MSLFGISDILGKYKFEKISFPKENEKRTYLYFPSLNLSKEQRQHAEERKRKNTKKKKQKHQKKLVSQKNTHQEGDQSDIKQSINKVNEKLSPKNKLNETKKFDTFENHELSEPGLEESVVHKPSRTFKRPSRSVVKPGVASSSVSGSSSGSIDLLGSLLDKKCVSIETTIQAQSKSDAITSITKLPQKKQELTKLAIGLKTTRKSRVVESLSKNNISTNNFSVSQNNSSITNSSVSQSKPENKLIKRPEILKRIAPTRKAQSTDNTQDKESFSSPTGEELTIDNGLTSPKNLDSKTSANELKSPKKGGGSLSIDDEITPPGSDILSNDDDLKPPGTEDNLSFDEEIIPPVTKALLNNNVLNPPGTEGIMPPGTESPSNDTELVPPGTEDNISNDDEIIPPGTESSTNDTELNPPGEEMLSNDDNEELAPSGTDCLAIDEELKSAGTEDENSTIDDTLQPPGVEESSVPGRKTRKRGKKSDDIATSNYRSKLRRRSLNQNDEIFPPRLESDKTHNDSKIIHKQSPVKQKLQNPPQPFPALNLPTNDKNFRAFLQTQNMSHLSDPKFLEFMQNMPNNFPPLMPGGANTFRPPFRPPNPQQQIASNPINPSRYNMRSTRFDNDSQAATRNNERASFPKASKKKKSNEYMQKRRLDMQREKEKRLYDAKIPCPYFLKNGECNFGDKCRFNHNIKPVKKKSVCKFYVVSACNKGDDCLFMHGEWPCKFYHVMKSCDKGNSCKFSHEPMTSEMKKAFDEFEVNFAEEKKQYELARKQQQSMNQPSMRKSIYRTDEDESADKAEEESATEENSKDFAFPSMYYELT